MTKYNLSKIMKRAWEIKRMDVQFLFSLCLSMAWAEAKETVNTATVKAAVEYKNVTLKTYDAFNSRRYGNPWVAAVDKQGKLDFSVKVGAYTGGYNQGEAGDLFVYTPIEGAVYAYGQKDYRKSKGYNFVKFVDGEFVEIKKTDLLKALSA